MFKGLITGVSGVRGIIGEGMTPEVALLWSTGFGSWLKGGKVLVARDPRPSGEMILHAVKAALAATGCKVEDIGVVPTPTAAYAVKARGANGGIIITASHNPQNWNALKFVHSEGRMLSANEFKEMENIVRDGPLRSVSWDKIGEISFWEGATYAYIRAVIGMDLLDLDRITKKKFKVALDAVNGAGSDIYPDLLETLGCEVVKINCTNSGIFPRGPEPTAENIKELCQVVKEEHCAVGFAVDPDGDRLAIVDNMGEAVGEEMTLAFVIKSVIKLKPGPIVVNSLTTKTIDDIANEAGVQCYRTKVGEANVSSQIKEVDAVIGGEGNGGVIFPEHHLVRDAGAGMALVLNELASNKKSLKELLSSIPRYEMVKGTIPVGNVDTNSLMEGVATLYDHNQISRIDGVKVYFDDGWVQVRGSNTEPILRVFAEASTLKQATEYSKAMVEKIQGEMKRLRYE